MASSSDRPLATGLANRLVAPILAALDQVDLVETASLATRQFQPDEQDIYLPDVQMASEQFGAQAVLFDRIGLQMPCLRVSSDQSDLPMPIAIPPQALPSDSLRMLPGSLVDARSLLTTLDLGGELVAMPPRDAVKAFRQRLTDFLETRFAARQSNISASPGLPFTVTTNSPRLRVYYSPIYWLTRQHVLNYPTSPAKGYVQPGRFYFGAALPGVTPSFDFTASYSVPPTSSAHLAM